MIAKASTISHGANAIRYSVNKEKADIVKANLLPDNISPEAMYGRMMLVQRKFAENINKGRPLGRNVIRIEISPSEEESRGWTMNDWASLSNEFIRVFDSIDLSGKTKRASSKQTNLKGSQYIAALHRDSKSGILHLHIDANRVDMEGRINDSHKIGERAVMAANIINERRGWMQSEEIGIRHRQEISVCCMEILRKMDKFSWKQYEAELTKRGYKVHLQEKESGGVYGYSIKRGNSIYKSSVLGIGRSLKDRGYLGETPSAGEEVRTDKTYFPTNTDSRYYSYFTACDKALQYSDRRISQLPCGDTRSGRQYHPTELFFGGSTSIS